MSKVVDSLLKDLIEKVKSPEVQTAFVIPLFEYILDLLYPYLFAIVALWVLILIGVAAILVFLMYLVS
jgi:hypothetical protein